LDGDFRQCITDLAQILCSKFNSSGTNVFLQARQLRGARDRDNPWPLREQSSDGDLRVGHLLAGVNLTGQEALTERTERNKPDHEFLTEEQHLRLGSSPP
jgi:hypothetical protein